MMLHITKEESVIMDKMHKLDENSKEYKELQKKLQELDDEKAGKNCPFVH